MTTKVMKKLVACESCLFTLEAISKVDRVEPNGIEEGYILVGRAPIYTPLDPKLTRVDNVE